MILIEVLTSLINIKFQHLASLSRDEIVSFKIRLSLDQNYFQLKIIQKMKVFERSE
jgi:hypothetical protein